MADPNWKSPRSGDLITKSSITEMHDAVAEKASNLEESCFSRATFGHAQVQKEKCSIIDIDETLGLNKVTADSKHVTTSVSFNNSAEDFHSDDVFNSDGTDNWYHLSEYRLDGAGQGYTIHEEGNDLLWWFNCRVKDILDASDNSEVIAPSSAVVFAFVLKYGGLGKTVLSSTLRVVHFFKTSDMGETHGKASQEIPVSIWFHQHIPGMYKPHGLESLRVYAAKIKGNAPAFFSDADKVQISNGTSGMLMFRSL